MVTMTEDRRATKGVSLWNNFVDDQDAEFVSIQNGTPIWKLPLEEIVRAYAPQERKRSRTKEPEGRAEARAHSSCWPSSLISSLDKFSVLTDAAKSRATLTKCGIYPIACWFDYVLRLDDVDRLYQDVDSAIRQIKDPFLNKDLQDRLESAVYNCPEPDETKNTEVAIVGWFKARVIRYAKALGMSYIILLGMAYEWWLTTTEQADVDPTNIVHRYCRDAELLKVYARERVSGLESLKEVAMSRAEFIFTPPRIVGGKVERV